MRWCLRGGDFLIIFLLTEMISLSSNVWLSMWSTQRFGLSPQTYLDVYIALVLFGTVTVPLRFGVAYNAMRQGSRNLHRLILRSVSIGTMQYFDTTPLGRIVNRFSRDVDCIDNQLQMTFLFLLRVLYSIFLLLLWPSTHSHMSFWHCFPRWFFTTS
ncbi:multidrug resistance protein A,p-glycoprotein [Trypanosoma cruzi]|uniref:Multidrug resistance protein A,p-glycoprotein n=1 Tax=Trypanosoma cruzi TaxID=5693 RepID=A0A2V2W2X7_TRYCR|nr:multidrug resistance protein A,p-glycoprotein [Trypanosoma cruzi]